MDLGLQTSAFVKQLTDPSDTSTSPRPGTPSRILVKSRSAGRSDLPHPCYRIGVEGCSSSVYKVVGPSGKNVYAGLLASRNLFSEHPRQDPKYLALICRQKPHFARSTAYFEWSKVSQWETEEFLAKEFQGDGEELA
ncbi:hypothetical protein B0H21DRAFT_80966 [Amylocystis lapponica]|nr:hypothetical protein B0H21DRAFT_80966 [Amylocystis lapponica]